MKTNIRLKLLAPLMHAGDERVGTMQIQRTLKFEVDGEYINIPVYSGNAFRGQLRRIAMRDYLEKVGIAEEGISAKLYHLFFTGGALTNGSRFSEIGSKRLMREMCPPLALFGSAIGDQIPEGKMKIGIFKPICRETVEYTGIESDISFYDMLDETFYTRRDDLKSKYYNITDETKHENAIQMKYEIQGLAAGTELISKIIIENSNEIEVSCLNSIIENFKELPFIGGKASAGHGEVIVNCNIDSDSSKYYTYLDKNKEAIRNWIRDLEGSL